MFEKITDFIREIFSSFDSGYLFFGGPLDLVRYILDIAMVTFILYNILRIIRETRAWQLLKGVLLILAFILVCSFFGLEMVGFIFNRLLYIVAILFVVIFQPELRHALETVGLKSFSFSNVIVNDDSEEQLRNASMVDEIVKACTEMSKTKTGAIMLLERSTKLGELLKQENVVTLDSSVTNSMLQSIFYKGSPMHDGALLIREGRIIAARCHVPLAETFHMIQKYGTRHRAAVGASEIGDTVAVVVSEERGTMSIAVDGVLYEMKDGKELRNNLFYLLGLSSAPLNGKNKRNGKKSKKETVQENVIVTAEKARTEASVEKQDSEDQKKNKESLPVVARKKLRKKSSPATRATLILVSFLFSLTLWMYIQVTTNPVTEKTFTLDLKYENEQLLTEQNLYNAFPIQTVTVRVVGRKNAIDTMGSSDLEAYIDYADIPAEDLKAGPPMNMEVKVKSNNHVYFRVSMQRPEQLRLSLHSKNTEMDGDDQ